MSGQAVDLLQEGGLFPMVVLALLLVQKSSASKWALDPPSFCPSHCILTLASRFGESLKQIAHPLRDLAFPTDECEDAVPSAPEVRGL